MIAGIAALRTMAAGPGWPLPAASAVAWAAVASLDHAMASPPLCSIDDSPVAALGSALAVALATHPPAEWAASGLAMTVAMTAPLAWEPMAHVWRRSLRERRGRAVALFALGHLATWLACMVALTLAAIALAALTGGYALVVALTAAVAWHRTASRARALARCHALPPLPAFGLAAERASLAFGCAAAWPCAAACWALMLVSLVADGALHAPLMAVVGFIMLQERYGRLPRLGWLVRR